MPRLTIYANGFKVAKNGHVGNRTPPKRGSVTGWSSQSARRNDEFLKSVEFAKVSETHPQGLACTFTMGDCPETAAEFHKRLKSFFRRVCHRGGVLLHYVVEWHLRERYGTGPVPHVHMVVFTDDVMVTFRTGDDQLFDFFGATALEVFWENAFSGLNINPTAQHIEPITDARGWAAYMSKHAARSVEHIQRNPDILPTGWENSGRMWGKRGDWPVRTQTAMLDDYAFYAFRRFANRAMRAQAARNLAVAQARLSDSRGHAQQRKNTALVALAARRIPFLTGRLQRNNSKIGRIVPMCDWLDPVHVHRWLTVCCERVDQVSAETGEIVTIWRLRARR
jgi:hypothetical protein